MGYLGFARGQKSFKGSAMAKFNEVQKKMRAQKSERKRAIHGDPITGKLKVKPQNHSISGKRKRKLMKKSNRDQKEAAAKGLLTDVQMADVDNEKSGHKKFSMKKAVKLKKLNRKGKSKSKAPKSQDAMVE